MAADAIFVLQLLEQELLLFAGFWLLLGALDDLAVDACWIALRLSGRTRERTISRHEAAAPLRGRAAVLIAAWHEADVIGQTVRHALDVWRQDQFTLYVGCYGNDSDTIAAAMAGAGGDPRIRIVINERAGPTTKADCLNRLYAALCNDESRRGYRYRSVVLHDSEDMVHPAALAVIDAALADVDFVQLPVRPEPQRGLHWVAGHYADEFAEAHAKSLVVRDALGAALPAAGVGCGFSRELIAGIAAVRRGEGAGGPFAEDCLTEDYELGVLAWRAGAAAQFLRVRDSEGGLVATRAYFPAHIDQAVRQKARWIHGIAFQGWDRLGWGRRQRPDAGTMRNLADVWMALRDRRGPLTAIVLASGYALIVVEGLLALAWIFGARPRLEHSALVSWILLLCFASFVWRSANRFAFTAREYGLVEGLRAVLRIPVSNIITIVAGRRALFGYVRTLRGARLEWDKTRHEGHPATADAGALAP